MRKNRNKDVPPLKLAEKIDTVDRGRGRERTGRFASFSRTRAILTVPDWMQHYTLRPIPEYLRASWIDRRG